MNFQATQNNQSTQSTREIFPTSFVLLLAIPSLAPTVAACFGFAQEGVLGFNAAVFAAVASAVAGLLAMGLGASVIRLLAARPQTGVPMIGRGFLAAGFVLALNSALSIPLNAEDAALVPDSLLLGSTLAAGLMLLGVTSARGVVERARVSRPIEEPQAHAWFVPSLTLAALMIGAHHATGALPGIAFIAAVQVLMVFSLAVVIYSLNTARQTRLTRLMVFALIPLIGASLTRAFSGMLGYTSLIAFTSALEFVSILLPSTMIIAAWKVRNKGIATASTARQAVTGTPSAQLTQNRSAAQSPAASRQRPALQRQPQSVPVAAAPERGTITAAGTVSQPQTTDLLAVLLHELAGPIRKQRQFSDLLVDELPEDERREVIARAQQIRHSAARSERIIGVVESIAHGMSREPKSTSLEACFEESLSGFEEDIATTIRQSITIPKIQVQADQTSVALVLRNLFINAIEHQGKFPRVRIDDLGAQLVISLTDDEGWGAVIDPSFSAPLDLTISQGRGMGLRVVGCLIRSWAGELSITELAGSTRIHFTLPVFAPKARLFTAEPVEASHE
ncbi:MAG: signal transduction histidine kinase [Planctomycetota bacterium]|jgi:signal transduction histidine kinase